MEISIKILRFCHHLPAWVLLLQVAIFQPFQPITVTYRYPQTLRKEKVLWKNFCSMLNAYFKKVIVILQVNDVCNLLQCKKTRSFVSNCCQYKNFVVLF